jgi:cytochrome o ubiquinol oxidase subunit 3
METDINQQTINHSNNSDKTILGFWIYLMTDLIMFAGLFAAYAVLRNNTFGGPGAGQLFSLPNALIETLILLTSSFTCGLAMVAVHQNQKKRVLGWLAVTAVLGVCFLTLELREFSSLIAGGNSFGRNAFLSSFFSLVATHGLHISIGLLWMLVTMFMVAKRGLNEKSKSILTRLSLFWHFLDLVWIFIFTIVYLSSQIR